MLPIIESPSPNHSPRPGGTVIDMLVLHYTGMVDAATALDRLTDPDAEVSAHYLLEEDGTTHRLVAEDRRALARRRRILARPQQHQRSVDRYRTGQSRA